MPSLLPQEKQFHITRASTKVQSRVSEYAHRTLSNRDEGFGLDAKGSECATAYANRLLQQGNVDAGCIRNMVV